MTGTSNRPDPAGFSKENMILRSRQHRKIFAVNQITSSAGGALDVVLARDQGVQGVAKCTYHTAPDISAVRMAACTAMSLMFDQGPRFRSIGTKMFKPRSAQAPLRRQQPAKISMISRSPAAAAKGAVPYFLAASHAALGMSGSASRVSFFRSSSWSFWPPVVGGPWLPPPAGVTTLTPGLVACTNWPPMAGLAIAPLKATSPAGTCTAWFDVTLPVSEPGSFARHGCFFARLPPRDLGFRLARGLFSFAGLGLAPWRIRCFDALESTAGGAA